ncbi:alpha/beta hydrolase fold domain-containing protein [Oceanobacillus luteolus]|uniref:Alpha/beta hydrolase fold domain-containing protein n=1 Tax=Oceanobacillus luteolus TaxID=1274358 RepID=A0ABW4HP27_9BACI
MRSIRSWLAERLLSRLSNKKIYSDEKLFRKHFRAKQTERDYVLPRFLMKRYRIAKQQFQGMDCYIFNHKKSSSTKTILYLHGGAYVNPPLVFHWMFLGKIAKKTGAAIYVPIYPKAPNHQYQDSFSKVLPLYKELLAAKTNNDIILMGDSAGGGFALALAQLLLEKKLSQPQQIILLSPWLDMTLSHPEIKQYEKIDPMLGVHGLIQIGKVYASDTDTSHYLLSPINGNLRGLGELTLFIGTHELLLPDARKLKSLTDSQGIKMNYFEYPKMNHVFPLYPIPEAKEAVKKIVDMLNDG